MSRSFKKFAVIGNAKKESEKKDKQFSNRSLRKKNRVELNRDEETFSLLREISDKYYFGKDGKHFCKTLSYKWKMK